MVGVSVIPSFFVRMPRFKRICSATSYPVLSIEEFPQAMFLTAFNPTNDY